MVLFNYATRELTAKIVYYGPGLGGKTTNLEWVHKALPEKTRGKMLSLATQTDRTLFFDFLPIDLGSVKGMKTRIQLYTVPGQVFYDATRKLVLKGADGVVFVADSQEEMLESNLDSWENLRVNLAENGLDLRTIPLVIQYNKRDLPNVSPVPDLDRKMNNVKAPCFEAIAITGTGVQETLRGITKLVLQSLSQKYAKDSEEKEGVTGEAAGARMAERSVDFPLSRPQTVPPVFSALMRQVEEEVKNLPSAETEDAEANDFPVTIESFDASEELAMEDLEELQEVEEVIDEPVAHDESHLQPAEPEPLIDAAISLPTADGVISTGEQEAVELQPDEEPAHQPVPPMSEAEMRQDEAVISLPKPDQAAAIGITVETGEPQAVQKPGEVSIPVEISVGKEGEEIRVQIAINLKIRLVR